MNSDTSINSRGTLIDLNSIGFSYGCEPIFRNFSMNINENEILTIIGPSGCGKSTLLDIIMGFNQIDSGVITVSDLVGQHRGLINASVIFQYNTLFDWMTVAQNITIGFSSKEKRTLATLLTLAEVMQFVDLDPKTASLFPAQISGGMKQKVAIARSLLSWTKLLILDEPFSSLDWPSKQKLLHLLIRLKSEKGFTILLVTHDLEEALYLSDRILVLGNSRPVQKRRLVTIDRQDIGHDEFIVSKSFLYYKTLLIDDLSG